MYKETRCCSHCGIVLSKSMEVKGRKICKYCRKRKNKNYYVKNKEKISSIKKQKNRKEKTKKICIICNVEFETARDYQVTCASKHCTLIHQRVKKRLYDIEKRKKKNVK